MDIIDDVIRHLGLRGRVAYRHERPADLADAIHDSELLQLHCVLDGACRYRVDGDHGEYRLQRGDVLLLPCGGQVTLLDAGGSARAHTAQHPSPAGAARLLALGVEVELAGRLRHPLFSGLPRVVRIDHAGFVTSGTPEHAGYLVARSGARGAGAESAIIDRLVEILLIQAIKAYQAGRATDTAFVSALLDPAVSRAIAAIHAEPGRNWSLERLAQASGLSRSAFSRRFTELTGVPAMHYLTAWRMQLALQKLRSGGVDLAHIARSVGYLSPAAFQKAFKRVHGFTPGQATAVAG
ncbi:MAG: AraC family transcriptional regulator [Gammaproteobacteria bacterium]|nr:AraC family transcriptional regulator [Gammaproteobacteria bacterium]